ncbi:GTPase [Gemmata sp. JC717]|uniref:GTPase n=1 Tax=Gemmata algarum TaxID=2975278 RepID=UPI0028E0A465|nr:GTPase [Gemmata algarum]MDY3551728.1 GTPase [Gemmata algarum]
MSDTCVTVLTPPGTGAIATVEVRGPRAWELARALFKPAGKPLPDAPDVDRFWFGTLGADEVVLAATAPDAVEVHCHGGRRVVRWVVEQFLASGGREPSECASTPSALAQSLSPTERSSSLGGREPSECASTLSALAQPLSPIERPAEGELNSPLGGLTPLARLSPSELNLPLGGLTPPARLLELAPTLRTANVILDQLNGAFSTEVRRILALIETDPSAATHAAHRLAELGHTLGHHLVEPWKVVVAGAPNVGKSSLVNALAGYQRAVVSDVAGTTRDAVSVRTAFDGWPFELIDTAGLRDAEGLERAGVERTHDALQTADLTLWVVDATDPSVNVSQLYYDLPNHHEPLVVANKCDRLTYNRPVAVPSFDTALEAISVSAKTGAGLPELIRALVAHIPDVPPGTAVPYTPEHAGWVGAAALALRGGRDWQRADAVRFLRIALEELVPHTAGPSAFPSNP